MTSVGAKIPEHLLSTDGIPEKTEIRKPENPNNSNEFTCNGQDGLMIGTVVFATLSLVPSLRTFSSLALRSIALVSTSLPLANWSNDGAMTRTSKFIKVGAVALGLTGIFLKTPAYVIASLVADIGHQTLEMIKYCKLPMSAENPAPARSLTSNALIIATNVIVISAIALASWKLMILAATVNIVALSFIGLTAVANNQNISAVCYAILAGLNVVLGISMLNISDRRWTINYTNRTDHDQTLLGNCSHIVSTLKPGETYTQQAEWYKTSPIWFQETYIRFGRLRHQYHYLSDLAIHTESNVPPLVYAQLPIGGTAIPETAGLAK